MHCVSKELHYQSCYIGSRRNCIRFTKMNIMCGCSGRLEQSTTGHLFCAYIINFQKHAQHIFSHILTNCFTEYEQRTLYGALVETFFVIINFLRIFFASWYN